VTGTRTPEGRVKEKTKKIIAQFNDIWTHWPVQTGYGEPTLDCIGSRKSHSFAIETKAPGKKLTPRQNLTREKMKRGGVTVFVVGEYDHDSTVYPYSGMKELNIWLLGL